MRAFASGILAACLAGCSVPPQDIAIEGLDLADGKTLAALQAALPLDDRAALGTYALLHWPKSKFYCGEPIGAKQAVAATVGEAIDQTRAYEKRLALAQAKARATENPSVEAGERILITRMEQLVFERDVLASRSGASAGPSPEGEKIEQQLTIMRQELAELRQLSTQ